MTLYSVMPMEQVWEGVWSGFPQLREVIKDGMLMQVEPLEDGNARIIRLLHCPLNCYLDPSLSPGSIITM
ncbi:YlzJ-like family protein [Paenibacillus sp. sgz500958]|uniref:YlzJ-like family protein n=1 Tax=Paenibacillus sp. sgz500958 TaxID=3242475 RepID=UPI0036D38AF9